MKYTFKLEKIFSRARNHYPASCLSFYSTYGTFHLGTFKDWENLKTDFGLTGNIADNKAKGRISKQVLQEGKAHQIFRKTNISYTRIRRRTCLRIRG